MGEPPDAERAQIAGDRAAVPDAGAAAGNAARFESLTNSFPGRPRSKSTFAATSPASRVAMAALIGASAASEG